MKTASVLVQTLCVPCACRCRHCLLSWDGKTIGAEYDRSQRYALDLYQWLRAERPEVSFHFSFGYSMDHPRLLDAIDFMQSIGSVGGEYLQMDGLRLRDAAGAARLMSDLQQHGVKQLNFTFYGTQAYHDAFAGRKGDFDFLLRLIKAGVKQGLSVSAGIELTSENAEQIDALLDTLQALGVARITLLVPHGEGRGAQLQGVRFSAQAEALLSPRARALLNRRIFRTEGEWVQTGDFAPADQRMLLLSLTPKNIGAFEKLDYAAALARVEALDEAYYAAIPPLAELAARYGDAHSPLFYRQRDLYLHYQKRFIAENGLRLYDVNDERQCGSRRY